MIEVDVTHRQGAFTLEAAFTGDGGITALFGPSGSGKSTLIDLIAGLRRPARGRIVAEGRVLTDTDAGVFVPRHKRRVGLVFQDALLFPHLTVRRNLLFGRMFAPARQRRIAFDPVVETLGIGPLLDRRPATLSGGERQRVAFGRALLASPRLLLMDEPLAALDTGRKMEVLPLVERLRDEFRIPILYVSHAVEEVARLASTVVMLEAGRVTAVGAPADVLRPARGLEGNRFAIASVLAGVAGAHDAAYGMTPVHHPAGTIWLSGRVDREGREVRVVVRGTDVALATSLPRNVTIRTALQGTVLSVVRDAGPLATVGVALAGGGALTAVATRMGIDDLGLDVGDRVFALVKSVAVDERSAGGPGPDGRG
ncbi:molybdenum ABC transporter ATP-binding protein [Chthonobacter rhizosphaerae]|uniref:molybdenum ABC transporter ATP-binding protein n=1 Tax=Chthonobacter rhizosphaerae TaxID=2735553 RepID=UPI0015EF1B84|nr:molybdenum ABC transporter ATP-binding protein [Chthonobacter rhizosphaerae]